MDRRHREEPPRPGPMTVAPRFAAAHDHPQPGPGSLPVLRALLRDRNVTRAGEAIGLTQSATSNALARLRRRFGDDLLGPVGREYEPCPTTRSPS